MHGRLPGRKMPKCFKKKQALNLISSFFMGSDRQPTLLMGFSSDLMIRAFFPILAKWNNTLVFPEIRKCAPLPKPHIWGGNRSCEVLL